MNQGKEIPPFGPFDGPAASEETSKMLKALQKHKSRDGVIKDSDGKVNSNLTPAEAEKYKKIFSIFKSVVFPGPEAGKLDKPTPKAKTHIGQSIQSFKIPDGLSGAGAGGGSWLAGIIAGLALMPWKDILQSVWRGIKGAFGLGKIMSMIKNSKIMGVFSDMFSGITKMFNGVGNFFKNSDLFKAMEQGISVIGDWGKSLLQGKWASKLGNMIGSMKTIFKGFETIFGTVAKPLAAIGSGLFKGGGFLLKMVGGIGAKLGRTLKFVPILGSIFNFATAVQAFTNGNYGRGVLELISGVAGLIPGAGTLVSSLLDGGLLLYDLMSESEEGAGIRDMLGIDGNGPMGKLGSILEGLGNVVMGVFKGIFGAVSSAFTFIHEKIGGFISKGFSMAGDLLRKIPGIGGSLADGIEGIVDNLLPTSSDSQAAASAKASTDNLQVKLNAESVTLQKELRDINNAQLDVQTQSRDILARIESRLGALEGGGSGGQRVVTKTNVASAQSLNPGRPASSMALGSL